MTIRVGRILATVIAIVVGVFVLADIFASAWRSTPEGQAASWGGLVPIIQTVGYVLVSWAAIVTAFAIFLGFANVVSVHWSRIHIRKPGAVYSGVLLASLFATLIFGLGGGPTSAGSRFIFTYILQPLESTFFALLALFMMTAAFRAFRVHNLESFFFVLFAVIVLLGQVPISIYLWSEFPVIKDWILNVPTLAGVRGILLGVALGVIATSLRIFIGADRPYSD
jgi:hypothetical protein